MTELVKYESMDDLERLGKALVASQYFADANSISKAIVKVLAGREMGFGPFASMTDIHIIQGKPVIGANLLAAAIKRHPHYDYRIARLDDEGCVIVFFEDGQEVGRSKFDKDDANAAGVLNKDNWKKFKRNMYFARAISNGQKWYCPDVFSGSPVYTPEEFDVMVEETAPMPTITVERPTPTPPADLDYNGELIDEGKLEADIKRAVEVVAEEQPADPGAFDDTPFTTPEAAIQWGVISGAFSHGTLSKNAYNKLKAEAQPQTSREMAALWRADVARRLAEKEAQA